MDSLWTTRIITSLDGWGYEAIDSSISQNTFSYIKMFSMKCRNNIAVENNKKSMKIADFINIHTNIYTYIICEYESKKKDIDSILQHGRVVDKNCCVTPTSGFPYLTLCPRQCKWKVDTSYLAIRAKNNERIWVWKYIAVKASTNYKKQHRTLRSMRKNKNNNFVIFIRSISR